MAKKGNKIGKSWSYRTRKINGKNKKVKVRKTSNGKTRVRVVGHRNHSDYTPKKNKKTSFFSFFKNF